MVVYDVVGYFDIYLYFGEYYRAAGIELRKEKYI